jgi:arylsulfatase A-like enzyme
MQLFPFIPRQSSGVVAMLAVLVAVVLPANAAPITWRAPVAVGTGLGNSTDVSVNGTLVEAYNAAVSSYTGGNRTVNGVTFLPTTNLLPGNTTSTIDFSAATNGGDAAYDAILSTADYGGGQTPAIVIGDGDGNSTINGPGLLEVGKNYEIQVWFVDDRTTTNSRVMGYAGGASDPLANVNDQYVIGTFTADATTQALFLRAVSPTTGFDNAHLTAYQIRRIDPPGTVPVLSTAGGPFAGPFTVNLSFNAPVTGLEVSDFLVENGSVTPGSLTGSGSSWSVGITPTANGKVRVTLPAASVAGPDGLPNSASNTLTAWFGPLPPNFLFIITDDQDTYSIGAYRRAEPAEPGPNGQPYVVDTPNIDRLAAEGMLFHQARIMGSWTGAVCTATRTSLQTGRGTWTAKLDAEGAGTAANTLPGIFNRGLRGGLPDLPFATYRTCKSGNSYPTANLEYNIVDDQTKRGNTDSNGSEWHADRSIAHINHWRANHQTAGKPFLMFLGFSHPHDTRSARDASNPPNLAGRYHAVNATDPAIIALNPQAPPLPFNFLPCTPATYPAFPFNHGHLNVRDETQVPGVLNHRSEAVVRNEIGRNLACVDWIDRQLGRVLAKLEDPDGNGDTSDSLLNNTYIVFTADHGIAVGRHGLMGKQNLYDHTWRVPYIVRGPGIAPGSRTNALVYLHDTFPTLADLAGLKLPPTLGPNEGRSFRKVLEGTSASARETLYGVYAGGEKPGVRAVTDGRFKLVKYDVGNNAVQVTQLFDLQENPFELLPEHGVANLANRTAYAGIRQRLEAAMMQQRIANADPYAFLGDRSLWRFENGTAGQPATTLADSLPFGLTATARSGNGGVAPVFSTTVPADEDAVLGEPNTLSLDFRRDQLNYLQVANAPGLSFGSNPFTLEARVKLRSMPSGANAASTLPVVMKRALATTDANIDYLFLATAGIYGSVSTFGNLALVLGSTTVVSSLALPDTGWHSISVAFDPVAQQVRFTLDGLTDVKSTTATGTANSGPLIIGAHFNATGSVDYAFDGLLDEISITNGFLAPAELQPLAGLPVPAPFRVRQIVLEPADSVTLTFESNENFLYDIQHSPDLAPGGWTTVRSFVAGTTGAATTAVGRLPLPGGDRGFYRVVRRTPAG